MTTTGSAARPRDFVRAEEAAQRRLADRARRSSCRDEQPVGPLDLRRARRRTAAPSGTRADLGTPQALAQVAVLEPRRAGVRSRSRRAAPRGETLARLRHAGNRLQDDGLESRRRRRVDADADAEREDDDRRRGRGIRAIIRARVAQVAASRFEPGNGVSLLRGLVAPRGPGHVAHLARVPVSVPSS